MRKAITALLLCGSALGQNTSPQPNFQTQVNLASPSLYLNFNDYTSAFKDQISGLTFSGIVSPAFPNSASYVGSFNGTNNAVETAASVVPTAITINGWVYVRSLPSSYGVIVTTNAGNSAQLMVKSTGKLAIYMYTTGGTVDYDGTGTTTLSAGNWYFISATYDSTNGLKGYVNGSIDGSAVANGTLVTTGGGATTIGAYAPGGPRYWVGLISGVSIYSLGLTSGQINTLYTGGTLSTGLIGQWNINEGTGTAAIDNSTGGHNMAWQGTAAGTYGYYYGSSGTATVRQLGFDPNQVNQTSAAFPYNGWSAAPNNTIGSSMEWNTPWTLNVQVDRLNWDRTGTIVLASKGDIGNSSAAWWKLTVSMYGYGAQVCFMRNGVGLVPYQGFSPVVNNSVCTGQGFDATPNTFGYNFTVKDSGTGNNVVGSASNALSFYVNGLQVQTGGSPQIPGNTGTQSYGVGFGSVVVTAFTSSGGGANCVVTGTFTSTSGVPNPGGLNLSADYGCSSGPTLAMTSPTGTGASLLATGLTGASMVSKTYPLMIPGYISGGTYNGIDQADPAQTATYIDEAAIFPSSLSQTTVESLFYLSQYWRAAVATIPATPYTLVFDNDGCADTDNIYALALTIAAQRIRYVRLAGVVSTTSDGTSAAMYRQMLDEAGLAHIPVSVPSSFASSSALCTAASLNIYNASTSQATASYMPAKTMYRQILAANPSSPVFIMLGGSFRGVADLMQSPADSISSLTGALLVARNATNGGAIYAQGLGANQSFTGDNSLQDWTAGQYVTNNNGNLPIYWFGGIPQNTGPGILSTRTGKDPVYQLALGLGTDMRQGYDSLPTQAFLSPLFAGGVNIAISGSGTGYAASTPFTSTGGGANCNVTGFMLSTSGVPVSIISTFGFTDTSSTYTGIGSGCITATMPPTINLTAPTGVGVVLTATTTASVCGTVSITGATAGTTTTATCSHHYFFPYSVNASSSPQTGVGMSWFINSLNDPSPAGAPRAR
jgi:hypothetical protein